MHLIAFGGIERGRVAVFIVVDHVIEVAIADHERTIGLVHVTEDHRAVAAGNPARQAKRIVLCLRDQVHLAVIQRHAVDVAVGIVAVSHLVTARIDQFAQATGRIIRVGHLCVRLFVVREGIHALRGRLDIAKCGVGIRHRGNVTADRAESAGTVLTGIISIDNVIYGTRRIRQDYPAQCIVDIVEQLAFRISHASDITGLVMVVAGGTGIRTGE